MPWGFRQEAPAGGIDEGEVMISRRQFTVAAGASVLSGCCSRQYLTSLPEPAMPVSAAMPKAAASWLGLGNAVDRRSAGVFASVDAHAHFFNASDVPVRGYLGQNVAHSQPPVLRELFQLLSYIADPLAELAPTAKQELASHTEFDAGLARRAGTEDLAGARAAWRERVAREDVAAAERVSEALRGSKFLRRYGELQAEAAKAGVSVSGAGQAGERLREISPEQVLDAVRRVRTRAPGPLGATDEAASANARIADGLLGFVFYMLSLRACNIDAHRRAYGEAAGSIVADHALGAMVDFDYWIDCPPISSHTDQIALHAYLENASGGYMKPIVAYNPWTDIELDGEGLRRVQRATDNNRFVGVKIYPPMGFYPGQNVGVPLKSRKRRPDLAKLDAALDAFFGYCEDNGVLVMAHAGFSSGRDDADDLISRPSAWEVRLKKNDRLRINFGHFGGEAGTDWTADFVDLMRRYPQHELYADIGYWDALTCASGVDRKCTRLRERLVGALRADIGDGRTAADRILYGTDWHMMSRVQDWPEYLPAIADWLEDTVGPDTTRKVMGLNARSLFGL